MTVDHDTALTLSALFAAVRLISEDIAKLPWQAYRRTAENQRERVRNSRVEYLLDQRPNNEMTAFSFRETLVAWALTWGNGYAEIQRDAGNRPVALWPIGPDRVECKRDDNGIYYEVSNGSGPKSIIGPENIYHLHGLGYDGLTGYSVISYAARSVGLGMAADQFGASFFGNNAVLGGYLEHPGKLGETAYDRLKDWVNQRKGPNEAFKPAILEEGMKWTQAGIPPEDAQFIEARKLTVNDMARWFRVPPHKIGDLERATFSNIEEQSISYVNDTLVSWVTRLEQEAQFKLIGPRSSADYTKINLKGLLRGSSKDRAEFYREMRNMGVYSVNEIRALEDENSIGPDGDKRVMQMNMTTLEKIGEDLAPVPVAVEEDSEINAKSIHYKLLEKSLIGIYVKEDRRFRASKSMVPEDNFVDWMNQYFDRNGEHIEWVSGVLTGTLSAVASDIHAGALVDSTIEQYLYRHIERSRMRALDYYRDQDIDVNSDARTESPVIIDSLVENYMLQRLENNA